MAKRKISGIINATEHPMNLETPWNQKQPDGTYHAYAGAVSYTHLTLPTT